MSRLYLLRHAKASWAEPGMRDFDRPLDRGGRADAAQTGVRMLAAGYRPERVLCSSARRARETLDGLTQGPVEKDRVHFLDQLYTDDAQGYLALIRDNGDAASLLVIGHNPMMEDLASAISRDGDASALAALSGGFPTSGLAVIRFADGFGEAAPGRGYLEAFLTPGDR